MELEVSELQLVVLKIAVVQMHVAVLLTVVGVVGPAERRDSVVNEGRPAVNVERNFHESLAELGADSPLCWEYFQSGDAVALWVGVMVVHMVQRKVELGLDY